MSLTWEPRWEPYLVNYAGMKFWTCRDKVTKLIACPICLNAVKTCLEKAEGKKASYRNSVEEAENAFFFSERDLLLHIKSHHQKQWVRERKTLVSTGEEG